ncbi:Methyl-accepting chemotaxis sensory transducer [uncultured delta proteobacterium]|uniref:Methyl-accepting chemotaxis sensory transducer n=1 Tax=uncultured delta proteobacterium TaxID=34034 RepID=A0A212KGG6_9DELT|nr:Methyl-accepting chemotaxis sensory transducer [uncultured delta proteobacterium]
MSIFKKLILLVSATISCLIIALCLTGYFLISGTGNDSAKSQLAIYSNVVQQEIEISMQAQKTFGGILQNDHAFARAVAAGNVDALRGSAKELMDSPLIDLVTICDAKGVVLLRGHSDKAGDTLPATRASMKIPLTEGKTIVGIEPGNVVKLTLASGVPIRHEGNIVGVAILGMDMTSGAFVKKIKDQMNVECTIFMDDTRVSTTVINAEGKPAVGTKLNNDKIYQAVISRGEKVPSRNTILGAEYDTVYWPWKDMTGKNAGILFVGLSRANIESAQTKVVLYFVLAGILVGLLMLACGSYVARAIVRPLRAATGFAEQVAAGNLDGTLAVTTKDEVGVLSRALGVMVQTLKKMILETGEKSREAEEQAQKALSAMKEAGTAKEKAEAGQQAILQAAANVEQVVSRVSSAVENINRQVDASTTQVTFQHERVTNSATAMEEMNATVLEVARSASAAAESSERAMEKAREGEGIVKNSIDSIINVQKDTEDLRTAMNKLGEQAVSIGTVMTVINDIADQTNLLALNAAIEAARAGEAGRGFAVVADEVRKLAEKTMDATKEVSSAITGIQAGARDSITAVDRTGKNLGIATDLVAKSGEALQHIVSESVAMADQIRSIATASEEQAATSEEIARSLDEINTSASETATAMQASSDATGDLTHQTHELQSLVQKLRSDG